MIEALPGFPDNVVAFRGSGHVTRNDYDTVLVPAVEAALKSHDKVRLFYKLGPDFTSIDSGAMWEDFSIGVAHLLRWERIAVVTDVEWIERTVRVFSFLMPSGVKVFTLDHESDARAWISA